VGENGDEIYMMGVDERLQQIIGSNPIRFPTTRLTKLPQSILPYHPDCLSKEHDDPELEADIPRPQKEAFFSSPHPA
jgi:hypothetical protein